MQSILFPQIDPIIFSVGPLAIRWYALAYVIGIVFGFLFLKKLNRLKPIVLCDNALDDIILFSVLGIVFGGRIGYVFFYDLEKFFFDPKTIFFIWKGGMSFHGGLIGLIFSLFLLSKKHKFNFIRSLDLVSCVAPIGLFFGRIANFINAELYGKITDVPWAVIFPNTSGLPRHPSQIYEALLEGILLFIIMNILVRKNNIRKKEGMLGGIFIASYGACRIFIEFFREPDIQIGYILNYFTMGQVLSLPMIIIGCYFIFRKVKISK